MEQQPSELQTGSVSESSGTGKVFVFNCPYLGTLDDVDTSLAYPAPANHCFRMNSPSAVELTHQEAYCLTDQHPGCHVFQMASAGLAGEEAAAGAAAPEKRKRRAGLYAFPLILILILLAAIIWWPAPGTNVQQSLVRGAQNDKAVSGGVTLNGKPDTQSSEVEQAAAVEAAATAPDAGEASSGGTALNGSDDPSSDTSGTGVSGAAETSESSSNAESQTALETEAATAPEQAVEPAAAVAEQTAVDLLVAENEAGSEETVPAAAAQEIAAETAEVTDEVTAESADSVEAGVESAPDAASEETAAETETISEVVTEADEDSSEVDEAAAVVTADLPILSSDLAAVPAAPVERVNTNSTSGVVTMVGPVVGTVLSLRDDPEDVKSLAVYQGPAKESALLSHIESRQFVTLLGRDRSGAWLNIQLNDGVQGWINTEQKEAGVDMSTLPFGEDGTIIEAVPAQAAEPAATSYPVIRSAYVNTGALNVRSGPGVGYDPITIVNSGELVGLIGRRALGPWVRVRLDSGLEGWVNSSLLTPVT